MGILGSKLSGKQYEDSLLSDWSTPPPWPLFRILIALASFLQAVADALTPPSARAINMGLSFYPAAFLGMAVRYNIPDMLKNGPMSAAQIAAELGNLREDDIYRVLRMLVSQGMFSAIPARGTESVLFRNNIASAALRADHPNSVKHLIIHWSQDAYDTGSQKCIDWHLRQPGGEGVLSSFEHIHGYDFWEYLKKDPPKGEIFSKAMNSVNALGVKAIVLDFDWRASHRIIDVGGAYGSAVAEILKEHKNLEGVLMDQPQVIEEAAVVWKEQPDLAALRGRTKLMGGDFFKPETLPLGQDGDVYFLRTIIHDWSDTDSIRILKSIRKAMGNAKARLALAELTGRERTGKELKHIFAASGFRLVKAHETRSLIYIIEGQPI